MAQNIGKSKEERVRLVRCRLRSLSRPSQRVLLRGQSLRLDRGRDPVQRRGDRRDLGRDLDKRRPATPIPATSSSGGTWATSSAPPARTSSWSSSPTASNF